MGRKLPGTLSVGLGRTCGLLINTSDWAPFRKSDTRLGQLESDRGSYSILASPSLFARPCQEPVGSRRMWPGAGAA